MFDRNSGGKTSPFSLSDLFESNLRSFALATLSALQRFDFFWILAKRQLAYKSWLRASGRDCHLMSEIGHLQKTEVVLKS